MVAFAYCRLSFASHWNWTHGHSEHIFMEHIAVYTPHSGHVRLAVKKLHEYSRTHQFIRCEWINYEFHSNVSFVVGSFTFIKCASSTVNSSIAGLMILIMFKIIASFLTPLLSKENTGDVSMAVNDDPPFDIRSFVATTYSIYIVQSFILCIATNEPEHTMHLLLIYINSTRRSLVGCVYI